ncbi:putative signal transducing protein [Ochrovirga pacifica]|uniref:putative signal transducing protein n=1 Tax=Ochrovirga pacifica TaxID=1042376 RepID=UPI0002559861|nr:DUF2007 domain-containing protein [Ochrovirga pacifica]
MSYVKIFSGSIVDTLHRKQLLQEHGIEPILKDRTQSSLLAGFGDLTPDYRELYVHQDELMKANELLRL